MMKITNTQSGTNVHEIAAGIYRISTPIPATEMPGGFTFNQFLIVDDLPLLHHTGPRRMFPLVREAVAHILGDVSKLRYVSFSHFEADECGSLNDWLREAPDARPACGAVAAMVSVNDMADREALVLTEDTELTLGRKRVRWLDTPNLPHNWECGHIFEATTQTLLCGDVLTHAGAAELPPLTDRDLVGEAEALRKAMPPGSVAIDVDTRRYLEKLAATNPKTLGLMHGSSFQGDGARVLRDLATALGV
jgi:flavorubredoxin